MKQLGKYLYHHDKYVIYLEVKTINIFCPFSHHQAILIFFLHKGLGMKLVGSYTSPFVRKLLFCC